MGNRLQRMWQVLFAWLRSDPALTPADHSGGDRQDEIDGMQQIEFLHGPYDGLNAYLDAEEECRSFLRLPVSRGTFLQLEGKEAPVMDRTTSLAIYQLCTRDRVWHYRFCGQVSPPTGSKASA